MKYLLLVYLFLAQHLLSQTVQAEARERLFVPIIYSVDINKSLLSKSVNELAQDSQGFIWVGTHRGLFRYDGYEYKIIEQIVDGFEFSKIHIRALYFEESTNILWIGSMTNGLFRYDLTTNQISQFKNVPKQAETIAANQVNDFAIDAKGALWIATSKGLDKFNASVGSFTHFNSIEKGNVRFANYLLDVEFDNNHTLWLATGLGLAKFDVDGGFFSNQFSKSELLDDDQRALSKAIVRKIHIAFDGRIWLSSQKDGSYIFEPRLNKVQSLGEEDSETGKINTAIIQPDEHEIWISGVEGIEVRNAKTGKLKKVLKSNRLDEYGLKSNSIYTMLVARSGIIWLGVFEVGLQFYNPANKGIQRFNVALPQLKPLFESGMSRFYRFSNDEILITTSGSSAILNFVNGETRPLIGDVNYQKWPIKSALIDRNIYWLGGFNGNFLRYDSASKKATEIKLPLNRNQGVLVSKIFQIQQEYLWIITNRGVFKFNTKTMQFDLLKHEDDTVFYTFVRAALLDNSGRLWLGMKDGIGLVESGQLNVRLFSNTKGTSGTLSNGYVIQIIENSQHEILVANRSSIDKLVSIGEQQLLFEKFAEEATDKLKSNSLLLADEKGGYWLGGLFHLNADGKIISKYDVADGIIQQENTRPFILLDDGVILQPSIGGINLIDTDKLKTWHFMPKIVATEITVGHKPYDSQDFNNLIRLAPNENEFSVRFSSLDFSSPVDNRYRYKLIGYDNEWLDSPSDLRQAKYTALSPGNYQLKIEGTNRKGMWSDYPLDISVIVEPFLFETWWFKISIIMTLIIIVFLLTHWRIKVVSARQKALGKIKLQAERTELMQELLAKKNELLANISHEFKTPLTLILGPLQSAIGELRGTKQRDNLALVKRNAEHLSRMVEQILELTRLEYKKPAGTEVTYLSGQIKQLCASLESLFSNRHLTFNATVEPGIWAAISSDSTEKIVVNLLTNAVKYNNENGLVELQLKKLSDTALITVSDSGIGIEQADFDKLFQRFVRLNQQTNSHIPGFGIGLAMVKELVEQVNGGISVKSQIGKGTTFSVQLPLTESNLSHGPDDLVEQNTLIDQDVFIDQNYLKQEIEVLKQTDVIIDKAKRKKLEVELKDDWATNDNSKPDILIVEDNKDMQAFIGTCLSQHFNCIYAGDGQEGVVKAIEHVPDLIVTDLMMPNKSGFELAKVLRGDERTSHIPIILLTARGDDESRIEAWKSDIDAYLTKPFDSTELVLRAKHILNIRQLLSRRISASVKVSPLNDKEVETENTVELIGLSHKDQKFLTRLKTFVGMTFADPGLNLEMTAKAVAMSERQLQRKLKALADQTLRDYIRNYRLQKAAQMLRQGIPITRVSLDIGFTSISYFGQCFKAHYGMSPSDYQTI